MSAGPNPEGQPNTAFRVVPFDAPLGAVVEGLDLSQPIDDAVFTALRAAYATHAVLVFRDQRLAPDAQIRFSRGFGPLAVHVVAKYLLPGHPEIFRVSNIVENGQRIGGSGEFWHTDLSYVAEPSRGSLLYAVEVPVAPDGTVLGDTQFASTAAAYEALAPEMKERLEGLVGVHRFGDLYAQVGRGRDGATPLTAEQKARTPDVAHPVVVRHPESGRRSLFVNPGFTVGIVGMADDDSAPLLRALFDHMTQQRFTYTHRWRLGDLVMWDNWATVHRAMGGYTAQQRRLMHRTTLEATVPFARLAA